MHFPGAGLLAFRRLAPKTVQPCNKSLPGLHQITGRPAPTHPPPLPFQCAPPSTVTSDSPSPPTVAQVCAPTGPWHALAAGYCPSSPLAAQVCGTFGAGLRCSWCRSVPFLAPVCCFLACLRHQRPHNAFSRRRPAGFSQTRAQNRAALRQKAARPAPNRDGLRQNPGRAAPKPVQACAKTPEDRRHGVEEVRRICGQGGSTYIGRQVRREGASTFMRRPVRGHEGLERAEGGASAPSWPSRAETGLSPSVWSFRPNRRARKELPLQLKCLIHRHHPP